MSEPHGVSEPHRASAPIRIVLAEDQAMVLGALAALLALEPDLCVIGEAHDGQQALDATLAKPRHRLLGRAWIVLMLVTAISGLAISPLQISPADGAALLVFATLPPAIRDARRGDLRGHRRAVARLLIALVIVGLLALLPGQLLHGVFFAGA